jgi:predicted component of type VI protein secretion system
MGTFYCLVPYEVVWNAKMQKAVSHSLCDVSEHERAVSAALEQLFGHALDVLPPSTLQLARFAVAMQGLKEARDALDALLGSSDS